MKRKDFLKAGFVGLAAASGATFKTLQAGAPDTKRQVGFEHIPAINPLNMKTVIHKAATRGHANHGWLDTHHTFSFANYYNPERMHFGALRVLNDDIVDGGMGFNTHPHDNMEIISIPLAGDLEHKDSMGNIQVIRQHDIQIMSAGTGIFHSEFNRNKDAKVNFLQIWVFPKQNNIQPRYDQRTWKPQDRHNKLQVVVSPDSNEGIWINQDAWFSIGSLDKGFTTDYKVRKNGNGAYFFVIGGEVEVNGQILSRRDGMGIWESPSIPVKVNENAELLVIDVPMLG